MIKHDALPIRNIVGCLPHFMFHRRTLILVTRRVWPSLIERKPLHDFWSFRDECIRCFGWVNATSSIVYMRIFSLLLQCCLFWYRCFLKTSIQSLTMHGVCVCTTDITKKIRLSSISMIFHPKIIHMQKVSVKCVKNNNLQTHL